MCGLFINFSKAVHRQTDKQTGRQTDTQTDGQKNQKAKRVPMISERINCRSAFGLSLRRLKLELGDVWNQIHTKGRLKSCGDPRW